MKFCDTCGILLTPSTNTGELMFHCYGCNNMFPGSNNETLLKVVSPNNAKNKSSGNNLEIFSGLLRNAPNVACIPKEDKMCATCKKVTLQSYVRIGETFTRVFTCSECLNYH